jgi:hypothetical protein
MKMGDGSFRPAFNVQLVTTCGVQVIVDMDVVNSDGTWPNRCRWSSSTGGQPGTVVGRGGFPAYEHIDAMADKTSVYAQVPEPACALALADSSTQMQIAVNRGNSQALSLGKKNLPALTPAGWRVNA